MRTHRKLQSAASASALTACLLLTACAHVWKLPITPVTYPGAEKISAHVHLMITDEFKQTSWEAMISPMDKGVIRLGDELVKESERLARAVFAEVTVVSSSSPPAAATPEAILIPKVVLFERTQPTTIFGQQTTTLEVEWRLKGRTGDTLWVDTIKGESTTKMGSNHKKSAGVQVQAALDQLIRDAFKSMTSSPDLRRLAGNP
jgi:hypothetical protein